MGSNGYIRVPVELQTMEMYGDWVLIEEDLGEKVSHSGLITNVGQQVTTIGSVLKVGSGVTEDIQEGDTVVYEAWMGGRYQFEDTPCLIMDINNILMVMRADVAS